MCSIFSLESGIFVRPMPGLTAAVILRCPKVAEIGCGKAPTVERLCGKTQVHAKIGVWLASNHRK
jgi:hypothetical protein